MAAFSLRAFRFAAASFFVWYSRLRCASLTMAMIARSPVRSAWSSLPPVTAEAMRERTTSPADSFSLMEKYGPGHEVEILAYATKRTVDAKMWDLNATKLRMINGIRKYDGSFTMEFDDEDSVSMAEMAALASGLPLSPRHGVIRFPPLTRAAPTALRERQQVQARRQYSS